MSMQDERQESMILRVANAIARYIGFDDCLKGTPAPRTPQGLPAQPTIPTTKLRLITTPPAEQRTSIQPRLVGRRHEQLRAYESPISAEVRAARQEAVRGMRAAHAGALQAATRHFAIAASCEDIDLTKIPGFWQLTRGQMQTAVDAYEQVQRYRDAAALNAQIESTFRPSLVGGNPEPIFPRTLIEKAATS